MRCSSPHWRCDLMMKLPPQVNTAFEMLEAAGYEAYLVGGAVRDYVRDNSPAKDWDITTNALPEQVEEIFTGYHLIETGLKHGTVTVVIDQEPLEITTYRVDGDYSDHRHPDSVSFTRSLKDDLERRDFTMNALAYNPRTGVVDFVGGKADIAGDLVRCVGDPDRRFQEDGLRMLRALRFASVYGMTIEAATAAAIHRNKHLLKGIAAERILVELNKKRLIVDEQVRDIIVMIFESCVAGMTTSEIAQMLNDMGIPSPLEHKRRNGGFYNGVVKEETGIWLKGAVRKILTDERYTGKMITNTRETEEVGKPKMRSLPRDQWIIVPGTHEAIISEELFRTAQNALQGRIRNVNKNTAGNRANNLFVCGCCGRKLRKNPAKEPHLVCPKNDSIKGAECAGLFVNQAQIEQAVLQMLREQSRSFLEQHCLMQACIDKKLSSIQTELDANTNMTRRLQSRKAELYEQYRAGRISREKFADIQKTDSEKLARLSSRAEEIKRLLVEHYESRGNLAAGKRTADQIILLKDYDPEIIRNFVERVRVYPSGEIEIDMRTSSGFEFVTAS